MLSVVKIGLCRGLVGLFKELINRERRAVKSFKCRSHADITVAGMSFCRLDAEQDEFARCCNLGGTLDSLDKALFVLDDMIRWHHNQNSRGIFCNCCQSRNGYGRSGIARNRFKNNGPGAHLQFFQFLANQKTVVVVAQQDRRRKTSVFIQAHQCGAKKAGALIVEKPDELFGIH